MVTSLTTRSGRRAAALVGAASVVALVAGLWQTGDGARVLPAASAAGTTEPAPSPPSDLREGELWLADMDLRGSLALTPQSRLRDVRMRGTDVLIGADGLTAGSVTVDAVVPFEVVAEQIGDDVTIEAAGRHARITRRAELLGREVRVAATGTVEAEDDRVAFEPTSVHVGAPGWLERRLGDAARRLVTFEEPVEGLPEDLELEDVRVVDDGFAVHLTGEDVDLSG